jgi:GT2 family glycosyltransferase
VDGFWMCIKRELFGKISWDDKTYNGFHCYDVDICMQVWQAGYKVQVIPDILIEHKSPGNTDCVYLEQNQRFFKKWENSLPSCHGVQLTHTDIAQRTQMVKQMRGYLRLFLDTERRLNNIQKSKAYRLGKFLLKPFELLKK